MDWYKDLHKISKIHLLKNFEEINFLDKSERFHDPYLLNFNISVFAFWYIAMFYLLYSAILRLCLLHWIFSSKYI